MDFSTATVSPVVVKIDGERYNVPRFLLPKLKAWAAAKAKAQMDAALAQYGDDRDARARFCLYFSAPPTDVAVLDEEARSPDGIERVLRDCLTDAGVDPAKVESLIANGDPLQQRALSQELCSARQASAKLKDESGDDVKNPSSGQGHTSAALPATGAQMSSESPQAA